MKAFIYIALFCITSCGNLNKGKKVNEPIACLYGTISPHTDTEKWFGDMKSWGTERFYLYSTNYRGYQYKINSPVQMGYGQSNFSSIPLISDLFPEYAKFIDTAEVIHQESLIREVVEQCINNEIEFGYMIPFPIFPVQKLEVVKQIQPQFIREDGRLNIYSSEIPGLLKSEVKHIKYKIPELKSICIWLAEGCGEIYKFDDDDLINNALWMSPIVEALDEVCEELGIEGVVFSHDYFHTAASRSRSYEAVAKCKNIVLMEDATWPEENTLMPFAGYITPKDKKLLSDNKKLFNFLTDTEYLGQGNWPAVMPRWWKKNVLASREWNTEIIAGRTFFWDNARSDQNFNRLNAHLLMLFANNPKADPKEMLSVVAKEAFGDDIPQRLIDILWETEPLIQDIISINGISSLNHSRFPQPYYLDRDYHGWSLHMKAVDDLFQDEGTKLYPEFSDQLNSGNYWRFQLKSATLSYEEYLETKNRAITQLVQIVTEIAPLTADMDSLDAKMFINGYSELYLLARGMKCFLEAAKVHYDLYRGKTISREVALLKMKEIAVSLRALAKEDKGYALGHKQAMLMFADQIESLEIKKGKW